jgi:hypothetical protein
MTTIRAAWLGFCLLALSVGGSGNAAAQPADEPDPDGDETGDEGETGEEGEAADDDAEPAEPAEEEPVEPPRDEMSITRELKTVEQNVNVLKEKVFRSKARLLLLEEKVIKGVVAGAKASLVHVNRLGGAYRIESISYFFDGTPIFEKIDSSSDFHRKKELKIFEGNIPPGSHTITANIVVKGNGTGAFSYLDDYSFKGQESYSFIAEDNKTAVIRMVLQKKGGALGGFEEGPEMKFEQEDIANLPSGNES